MKLPDKLAAWRIKAKTQQAAYERYRRFLQQSLTCLSARAFWIRVPLIGGPEGHFTHATTDDPLTLERVDGSTLYLALSQQFHYELDRRFPKEWKVKTDGYAYTLAFSEDLSHEFLRWEWHPKSRVAHPHLHVTAQHDTIGTIKKLHLPTGRVSFEEIVRLLIKDLGVISAREDWRDVLTETEQRFKAFATWR